LAIDGDFRAAVLRIDDGVALLDVNRNDTAKEKPQQGEVLAVGPGRRSEQTGDIIPIDVKKGDTVVYSKYGGTEITVDGQDVLILNARDVLAVIK